MLLCLCICVNCPGRREVFTYRVPFNAHFFLIWSTSRTSLDVWIQRHIWGLANPYVSPLPSQLKHWFGGGRIWSIDNIVVTCRCGNTGLYSNGLCAFFRYCFFLSSFVMNISSWATCGPEELAVFTGLYVIQVWIETPQLSCSPPKQSDNFSSFPRWRPQTGSSYPRRSPVWRTCFLDGLWLF